MITPKQQDALDNRELNRQAAEEVRAKARPTPKSTLMTLAEHNSQALEKALALWFREDMRNGLACNECGHEMRDLQIPCPVFPLAVYSWCDQCHSREPRYL